MPTMKIPGKQVDSTKNEKENMKKEQWKINGKQSLKQLKTDLQSIE